MDDYRPIWVIEIVQELGFSKILLPQMIYSSKADDISSMVADHHLWWPIIIPSG
jgi:hypothetical protein